ncbi:MAG: hypothetical protein AVDCRST_MAG39-2690, partial [uncultured Sphingomonadaceae bacterium]
TARERSGGGPDRRAHAGRRRASVAARRAMVRPARAAASVPGRFGPRDEPGLGRDGRAAFPPRRGRRLRAVRLRADDLPLHPVGVRDAAPAVGRPARPRLRLVQPGQHASRALVPAARRRLGHCLRLRSADAGAGGAHGRRRRADPVRPHGRDRSARLVVGTI